MRIVMLTGALLAMALPAYAGAENRQPDTAKVRDTLAKLQKAVDAAQKGDCATATRVMVPMLDGHDPSIPADLLPAVYQIVISCEIDLKRHDDAYRHALAGSALDNSDDDLWRERVALELDGQRTEAAVASVEAMSQGRGAALNAIPIRWFYDLDRDLRKQGLTGPRGRLLAILSANAYVPKDQAPGVTDGFRHERADMLLDAGDRAGAAALLADVGDPHELVDVYLDPRLRPLLSPSFDLRAAVERGLAATRAFAALHPDMLNPVVQAAGDLRMLGRPQEALDMLRAVPGVESGGGTFSDADDYLAWWWDGLGRTYAQLNHFDDAVAAFRKGGEKQEGGSLNVSQVINLAEYQLDFGHPADTLTTIGQSGLTNRPASPFGTMQVYFVRGCAAARLNQAAEVATVLKYMRDHEKDAPGALSDMLLCSGDLDGAAALMARRLADPETRADALRAVAVYDAPVVALPLNPIKVSFDKMVARPEVQAAIQRAGGAQRVHLQQSEL